MKLGLGLDRKRDNAQSKNIAQKLNMVDSII
jgi:hypothetical protein